jgi:hypothetical protein
MSAVFAKHAVLLERGLPALYCRLPFLRRVFGEFLPIRFCSGVKNVYKKLQVNSRTEAVLRLGKSIGNDTSSELGKSTVEISGEPADNGGKSISTRRIPMNKMYLIFGGLLTTVLVVVLVLVNIT